MGFSACAAVCSAQYRVLPGELDADGLPTSSARICLGVSGTDHCYAPQGDAFGLEPKAQKVAKFKGGDLILFTATFSGGGSGTMSSLSLLTVRKGELVNILPAVELTNLSDYKIWNLPRVSNLPVLVTADFIWDFNAGETHVDSHHYRIEAYVFDARSAHFRQRISYVTKKKYPGLDEVELIRVLDVEKPAILAKLQIGSR